MRSDLTSVVLLYALLIGGSAPTLMAQTSSGQINSQISAGVSSLVSSPVSTAVVQGTAAGSGRSDLRLGEKIASSAIGQGSGSMSLEGERIAAEKLAQGQEMLQGRNEEFSSLAASGQLNSSGYGSQAAGSLSQASSTVGNSSAQVTTGQSVAGVSSSGGGASQSGSSALAGGQFPDSTRSAVSISPPFEGEDLFSFSPMPLAFHPNFDGQHLNPNYKVSAVTSGSNNGSRNIRSLSNFNPNNIQQGVPATGLSVSPSDPIAAALQAILHPDQ